MSRIRLDIHGTARPLQRSGPGAAGGVGRGCLTRHAHCDPRPIWIISGCGCMCRRPISAKCTGARRSMCRPIRIPDKIYHGRVSFISSEAEFTPKSVQTEKERVTLVYRVKVDLDNPNQELKPGMPADVDDQAAVAETHHEYPLLPSSFPPRASTSAKCAPSTGSALKYTREKSLVWSVPTAPAKPPRCGCWQE